MMGARKDERVTKECFEKRGVGQKRCDEVKKERGALDNEVGVLAGSGAEVVVVVVLTHKAGRAATGNKARG